MRRDGITAVVSPCHPETRGVVGLRSADPDMPPRIYMRMLDWDSDIQTLLRGCRLAHDMLRAGPGKTHQAEIYAPCPGTVSDGDWVAFFRQTAALNWHPTSTCRMGNGDEDVVDASLRVHGIAGLSVADASVMPSVPSANTNAPVIAIAERAAQMILARTN